MPICRWLLVGCVLSAAIIAESPDMDDDLAEVFEGMAPFPARSVSSSEASGSSNQPAGATPAATSGAPSDDPNNAPIAPEAVLRGVHIGLACNTVNVFVCSSMLVRRARLSLSS